MAGDLVTVVVPARNEAAFIERCLTSILEQTYEDLEVIVVDGASTDATPDIVRALAETDARVRLLRNERAIIPTGLNLAVDAARGTWLVRVDAHSTVPPDYVARAVELLATGRWGGVGGRKDGVGVTPAGTAIAVAMGSRFGVGNSTYHHGEDASVVDHIPFGCYPLALIRELGGWDETLRVNQDFEFDQRVRAAGHELLFDPSLRIDWHCRQSIGDLRRQYERYGKGKTKVFLLHPDSIRPRQVLPAALLPAFLAAGALLPRWPRLAGVLVAPYAAFVAAGTVREQGRLPSATAKLNLPGAFLAMHLGFSRGLWSGWFELLRDRFSDAGT